MRPPEASGEMPGEQTSLSGTHVNGAGTSGLLGAAGTSNVDPECDYNYVKQVGETIGIANLPESCAAQVGVHVSYVIKALIEQSKKFATHGRRKRLISDDFDSALIFNGFPPVFGFTSKEFIPFRFAGTQGRDLFVSDDRDVDVTPLVNAPPTKLPLSPSIKAHWLAIDGVQPAVPENPTPMVEEEAAANALEKSQPASEATGATLFSQAARAIRKTEQVQIKTITTHALSVEQQIFFKEITEAIMGSDDGRRTEALHSLQTDAGLQALLPRLSLAIAEGVRCNIVHHNLAILIYLMRMIQSLALNPAISLDRCLHELLPSILSCILSKQLCARPDTDNHWALREFSSRLLATICKSYNVNNLRSRVTQVLTRAWRDEHCTLSTLYGSLYALNELGVDTIRAVVVPRAAPLYTDIRKPLLDKANSAERIAAEKLQNFLTKVLVNYVRTQRPPGLKDMNDYRSTFGGFADAIYRTISMEVPHPSTTSGLASAPSSSGSSTGASPLSSRSAVDIRSGASANPAQRVQLSQQGAQRFVQRPQGSSPTVRQIGQSASSGPTYVSLSAGGRVQATTPVGTQRATTPSSYYVSGSSAPNTPAGSFITARPSVPKKIVVSQSPIQRGPSGPGGDSYRNI